LTRSLAPALLAACVAFAAEAASVPSTLVYPTFKHDLGLHHVNDFHLRLFTGNKHRFRDPRGVAAVKLVERDRPDKTSDDDELTVYGVNSGESCIIYNTSPTTLASYGREGSGSGCFRSPWGIAANPAGDVYVADSGNDRVVHLRCREGKLHEVKTLRTGRGDADPLREPRGVSLAANGDLYIADTGNGRIVVLDRAGAFLRSFGEGSLVEPEAIAVLHAEDPWSCRPDSFVIAVDRGGTRVSKLRPDGAPLASVTADGLGLGGARFRGVAVDYHHQVYLTDEAGHRIVKLSPDLHLLASFGREGDGGMEFQGPFGITVWRRFGQFFISERAGAQYMWVGVDVAGFRTDPADFRPGGRIVFHLTERARATVEVLDGGGNVVRALAEDRYFPAGEVRLRWDALDDRGRQVPAGRYRVRIRARATYSSSKYFEKSVAFPLTLG
jgi:DNA-binding beta-propeller fold protein YncE